MTFSIPDYNILRSYPPSPNIHIPLGVCGYWTKSIVLDIPDCDISHPRLQQMPSLSPHYAEFARLRKCPKG